MSDDPQGFNLVEPFDIDDGQLDGVSKPTAFCLGVELATFRARLLGGRPFADVVLSDNAERLVAMAERHGRFAEHAPAEHGWSRVVVGGMKGEG